MENKGRACKEKTVARVFLNAISQIAEKNANAACRGFMYEPKVPKKLRK